LPDLFRNGYIACNRVQSFMRVIRLGRFAVMCISIRQATPRDIPAVVGILREAAQWLEQSGMPMWQGEELDVERIAADVGSGMFFLAECSSEPAGTVKF
jgi:hypothetical protein